MPTAGDVYYYASKQGVAAKPAVVLIHGAGGDHLHWPHNLRRLGKFRVYAPDLPGHGKSAGIGEQTVQGYADALIHWLDAIGVARAIFVGHSMGGAIAQTIALEYPEYVLGLGLVATGSQLGVNPDLMEKLSTPASAPAAIDLIVKWSYSKNADKKLLEQVHKGYLNTRPAVVYGDFKACSLFDASARLGEIDAPTCVICGTEDKMTPIALSECLAERIPHAALTLIPGAGHMAILERPDAVVKALWDFLGQFRD